MWILTNTPTAFRNALTLLLVGCLHAPAIGQSPERSETDLLEVLRSDASDADKSHACRQLQSLGTEQSIPLLGQMLCEPGVSHAARMALGSMPSLKASEALRENLAKTDGLTRIGIIHTLGTRRDAEAADAIGELLAAALQEGDAELISACCIALGKTATPAAEKHLLEAHTSANSEYRSHLQQALLQCAHARRRAGKREQALELYHLLTEPEVEHSVRVGAFSGEFQLAGGEIASTLSNALAGDDHAARQAAASQLPSLSAEAMQHVAAEFSNYPAHSQVAVLAAIRSRREASLADVALTAAQSDDTIIRLAGIRALGAVGDRAAIRILLAATKDEGDIAQAARDSLGVIFAAGVDEELAAILRAEDDPASRADLIALVESRRMPGAVDIVLTEATHDSLQVRERAMQALTTLAGREQLSAMTRAVLAAQQGSERDAAEKAVMLVIRRVPASPDRSAPVLEAFADAASTDQNALLPLLGRIGGPEAQRIVLSALDTSQPPSDAAVRALCNWPDASLSERLLQLANSSTTDRHRLWALRAYIRVVSLPDAMPAGEQLKKLALAFQMAEHDDERKLVLQRAAAVRTIKSLRFLLPHLDEPNLCQVAGGSIAELARHDFLRDPHLNEFIPALERVVETNQDPGTIERARRYLQAAHEKQKAQ
ncbi:HEAT repeat domain-containing protein [Aeoliella sp.]|uniref:HEAT repeat domain-containing protein n=1 Tax=Aeoliella sp. TaxID=2795800 RepID=UPI003CCC26A5